jgi:hypothetical protein
MTTESYVASLTIYKLCNQNFPINGVEYEDIEFPENYNRPSKESYEHTFKQTLNDELMRIIRIRRDNLLNDSDWLFLEDCHLTDNNYKEWTKYRQSLRDLPSITLDPKDVIWPTKPKVLKGECSIMNENLEIKQLISENVSLRAKMTKLEKRVTDLDLSIIQMKRMKNRT